MDQAKTECARNIVFAGISPQYTDRFEGRIEWRDNDILVEIKDSFDNQTAEYIAAHELCHALQLGRGYPIAAGRMDEPGAVAIATDITDLVYDSWADTIATEFGLPMASEFKRWLKSTPLLGVLKTPRNGRRYGTKWANVWERLKAKRINDQLGLKAPPPPKEFWTLWVAFDLGNVIRRAESFGLALGGDIRKDIQRLPLLAKVVDDLLNIASIGAISNIDESVSRLLSIFDYIQVSPGHMSIYKPLTDEIYVNGQWARRAALLQDGSPGSLWPKAKA